LIFALFDFKVLRNFKQGIKLFLGAISYCGKMLGQDKNKRKKERESEKCMMKMRAQSHDKSVS
jgi:hypothetical protein